MSNFYCPQCSKKVNEVAGCGSVSYFCPTCKKLVSRSAIISEEKREEHNKKSQGE